jgi:hypothetical protein
MFTGYFKTEIEHQTTTGHIVVTIGEGRTISEANKNAKEKAFVEAEKLGLRLTGSSKGRILEDFAQY